MPIIYKSTSKSAPVSAIDPDTKIKCMLAASEIPCILQLNDHFPLLGSYKLDGIRSLIAGGKAMSRKMLPLPNKYIQSWVSKYAEYLEGLDGELVVGMPNLQSTFNTTSSGVMSSSGASEFKFYVFDHWNLGSLSAAERHDYLSEYLPTIPSGAFERIVLLDQKLVHSEESLASLYDIALTIGYEGLILRKPTLPYKFGRSTLKEGYALKWKEFIDLNCIIVGVKQGKTNTNELKKDELGHAKRSTAKAGKVPIEELGGFYVSCVEEGSHYYAKTFNVGPGSLTQDELRELWKIREKLPGRHIRVKAQKSGGKDLPRYPSFNGWLDPMNMA